jgi:hypothetical protein
MVNLGVFEVGPRIVKPRKLHSLILCDLALGGLTVSSRLVSMYCAQLLVNHSITTCAVGSGTRRAHNY